jgi:hypothetical protein
MTEEYMFSRVQIFSIIGALALIVLLLVFIRRKKLREEYSILWLVISAIFLATAIFGQMLVELSKFLGIVYPPATLFLLLIVGLFLLMMHFSIIISDLKRKLNDVSIKLALLEDKIEQT